METKQEFWFGLTETFIRFSYESDCIIQYEGEILK